MKTNITLAKKKEIEAKNDIIKKKKKKKKNIQSYISISFILYAIGFFH